MKSGNEMMGMGISGSLLDITIVNLHKIISTKYITMTTWGREKITIIKIKNNIFIQKKVIMLIF